MTDPTITIAGLRAERDTLLALLRAAIDDTAASVMARASVAAERAGATAERDALAAQLAEARAVAADLDRDLSKAWTERERSAAVAERDKLRADLASERAHLAACRTRIAGLEAAANKHRAEIDAAVGQLAAARQVIDENRAHAEGFARDLAIAIRERDEERATVARLIKAVDPKAESTDDALRVLAERTTAMITADREVARLTSRLEHASREWTAASDDASTAIVERDRLTARVAELEARPVLTVERLTSAVYLSRGIPTDIAAEAAKRILAALGPVTLPPAQDRAEELAAARWAAWRDEAGDTPTTPWDDLRDHRRDSEVRIMKRALRVVGAPPTSQPAARPAFAGVSEEELALEYARAVDRIPGIRAVLARLEVSLVAPVDPEEVARDFYIRLSKLTGSLQLSAHTDGDRRDRIETMRTTLLAADIPVTPEVGK